MFNIKPTFLILYKKMDWKPLNENLPFKLIMAFWNNEMLGSHKVVKDFGRSNTAYVARIA